MDTNEIIQKKFNLDLTKKSPIALPISRFKGLPDLFNELEFKVGAEIGVATGRYSKALCQRIKGLKLYCIDPWTSYDEYVEHHDTKGQEILDDCFKTAKNRLASYNCEFIRKFSMEAVKDFKDESLDFVFIDGNHTFQYVVNDIAEWSKKVKKGGIISGHDFWRSVKTKVNLVYTPNAEEKMKLCQVRDAVESWTYANQIKPWFITTGDKCLSWFYVKI